MTDYNKAYGALLRYRVAIDGISKGGGDSVVTLANAMKECGDAGIGYRQMEGAIGLDIDSLRAYCHSVIGDTVNA